MNQTLKRLIFTKEEINQMNERNNKIQNCWDKTILEQRLAGLDVCLKANNILDIMSEDKI